MDNEPSALSLVKNILEEAGYEVVGVRKGEDALAEIKADSFDLILLDIMMPNLSGWDVFTRIIKEKPHQKIAFLTILEVPEERKATLEDLGVAEYFTKPVDPDDFIPRIKTILGD
ncbi:MAG: hypothetical protein BMS9Abin13_404 [Patescibacteria group bacterium]|nr:MAG: hypothetical protein BMS9Abin13_404 [Patescibacteria group bacterium]